MKYRINSWSSSGSPIPEASSPQPAPLLLEDGARQPDGWFHEELAEEYAALGRESDAREHARRALPLLLDADPSFEDSERATRLRLLASSEQGS